MTHAFGSCGGTSESCTALVWSWDGMIIVALVLHIQKDSSIVFPIAIDKLKNAGS